MGLEDRDWYREELKKKRKPASAPWNSPKKPLSRRQRRKNVRLMNQTRHARGGSSIWRPSRGRWFYWLWGVFCLATWVFYAAEYRDLFSLHDVFRWFGIGWDFLANSVGNVNAWILTWLENQ